MGASEAISALRSEAVAKTGLINVVSENIAGISSDNQKQAGMVRESRTSSRGKMESENNHADRTRMSIRSGTRSAGEATLGLIFNLINAATGSSGSALNLAADAVAVGLDVATIVEDMYIRDRHMRNARIFGHYVQMYTPGVLTAR